MPGLVGHSKSDVFNLQSFNTALDILIYDESYKKDEVYQDANIIASRAHLNIIGEKESPFRSNNCLVWVEGEVYNLEELSIQFDFKYSGFAHALTEAFISNKLAEFCSYVNGYFSAVIYHVPTSEVIIVSDRYGLKPVYIYNKAGALAWASELKCFKYFLKKAPEIDPEVVDIFLELGYITGSRTWFQDVHLADAATLYRYNLRSNTSSVQRYWTWSKIIPQKMDFDEAVDKLHFLLTRSVNEKTNRQENIGLTLSGGTDSRVILSLLESPCSVETLTWGVPDSVDVILAKKVAKKKGCEHSFLKLTNNSWYSERETGVWKTDGMFNLMHMHSSGFHSFIKKICDINLNGFSGDLNVGGGWITKYNSRITQEVARKKLGVGVKFAPFTDSFYDIEHEDPYFLDTRVRRFTNSGSIEHAKLVEQRKPFYDNNIMEFIYGLPDEYRANSRLYNACITRHLPELFKDIHTTHGIVPIGQKNDLLFKIRRKIKNLPIKLKLQTEPVWKYHNYAGWIRDPEFSSYLLKMLNPEKAVYPSFTNRDLLKDFVEPHLSGKQDLSEKVLAALTMELWFRQIFNSESVINSRKHI